VEIKSSLLAGIVLAGLFVYLFQTHPFEEFALNLEVIAIALGKVTEKASGSALAQGIDQGPNTVIDKISFAPNLCHNDCPRFVRRRVLSSILQPLSFSFQVRPVPGIQNLHLTSFLQQTASAIRDVTSVD
jgi:hypothetical protein